MSAPVLRFLASIGRPAEAELYLSLYRAERPESFAVISVDSDVVGVAGDALAVDLEFLAQLGLTPILVFEDRAQAEWLGAWLADSVPEEVVGPERAAEVARRGGIPLVPLPPGELAALAASVQTHKLVLLGPHGRMVRGGEALSIVDLTSEYDDLAPTLSPPHRALLDRARALIDAVPHPMTVAVTSPLELLRELFTVRGAGTLIRRGAAVTRHDDYAAIDRDRLTALIETSFGRRLRPVFWQRPVERIYIAGDYRGAAIVTPTDNGPYLSKLAVDAPARGEGIGRDLWRALTRDVPTFYWRARGENPIASWYLEQCDGMTRIDSWRVYWRGLAPARIPAAIAAATAAPHDFD